MGAGPDAVPDALGPLGPGVRPGQGPGWAKLSAAVAARIPATEIDTVYLFRPMKREGREWGTAVVTRRSPEGGGRLLVDEVALSPAEVIAQVMQRTAERTGEAEPPVAYGPAVWYEG
jgi:hypothetical protein